MSEMLSSGGLLRATSLERSPRVWLGAVVDDEVPVEKRPAMVADWALRDRVCLVGGQGVSDLEAGD